MNRGVGFGVFSTEREPPRVGFRVGTAILDLAAAGLGSVFAAASLNGFLALGRSAWEDTLGRIDDLVGNGIDLVPLERARMHLPFEVADYVDFYSSLEHATNLGRMFRPDSEPLLPNWRHLPVAYHGRSGTVVVSGTPVLRPCGQSAAGGSAPRFGPSHRLDLELEVELSGTVVSRTNARGLYWTMPQQLAHATVNGASVRTGDLFASGTISGPDRGSEGSLIELTWNGEQPIRLGDGSMRTFLEDGDEVVLRGRAGERDLGEVRGTILAARC